MVIQRIQTLLLLIAAILMAVFCYTPFATAAFEAGRSQVFVHDIPTLLALNIAIAAILLVNIFMYKNLRLQMRTTILSMILICASVIASGFIIYVGLPEGELLALGGDILLIIALLLAFLAYKRIKHDHKLLTSTDRLR